MNRSLLIGIAIVVFFLISSCSRENNNEASNNSGSHFEEDVVDVDSLTSLFSFDPEGWINRRVEWNSYTQAQRVCVANTLTSLFDQLSLYVATELVKKTQWKAAKKIIIFDKIEYDALYNDLNNCLLEGDVSFKSCEVFINESILQFNDSHQDDILHTISLPRTPDDSLIDSELVKRLFLFLDTNYSDLKRKEKRALEVSLLVSAISKRYADFFDENDIFGQTLK